VRRRPLGSTGLLVSELCLGTMTFGAESDEAASHAMLDRYVEAGGNFIDTADVYSHGVSEEIIGRWLARRGGPGDLVIATKARFPMGDDPNRSGLSRAWLTRAVDDSLRRLGVETIDLYQAHCWDPATPLEETIATYEDLVRGGKVRYVGVSNFTGWQLQRAALLARQSGLTAIASLQPQYNLLSREMEWELVPVCLTEGIGILPWSPLGGGWLTGKYRREERPTGATRLGEDPERGVEAYDRRNTERTWRVVDAVVEIAAAHGDGSSPAQVAINWLLDRPAVTSVILGARTVSQLEDNLGAADWSLSAEEADRLDEASDPGRPDYPYRLIDEMTRPRAGAAV
jgi:aryl-alcohol dehydrogenase-like predicted oxidoreductase